MLKRTFALAGIGSQITADVMNLMPGVTEPLLPPGDPGCGDVSITGGGPTRNVPDPHS